MHFLAKFEKDGTITFASQGAQRKWNNFKNFFMASGTYFSLTVNDVERNSTEAQHKLFQSICYKIADASGEEVGDIMKHMQRDCLPVEPTGEFDLFKEPIIEVVPLVELSTKQFQVFLEKVVQVANEYFNMGLELHSNDELGPIIKTK